MAWLFSSVISDGYQNFPPSGIGKNERKQKKFHLKTCEIFNDFLIKFPDQYSTEDINNLIDKIIGRERCESNQSKFYYFVYNLIKFLFLQKEFDKQNFINIFKELYGDKIYNVPKDQQGSSLFPHLEVIIDLIFLDFQDDNEIDNFRQKYFEKTGTVKIADQLLAYHESDVEEWKQHSEYWQEE